MLGKLYTEEVLARRKTILDFIESNGEDNNRPKSEGQKGALLD